MQNDQHVEYNWQFHVDIMTGQAASENANMFSMYDVRSYM